jgi:hypothetical protein
MMLCRTPCLLHASGGIQLFPLAELMLQLELPLMHLGERAAKLALPFAPSAQMVMLSFCPVAYAFCCALLTECWNFGLS